MVCTRVRLIDLITLHLFLLSWNQKVSEKRETRDYKTLSPFSIENCFVVTTETGLAFADFHRISPGLMLVSFISFLHPSTSKYNLQCCNDVKLSNSKSWLHVQKSKINDRVRYKGKKETTFNTADTLLAHTRKRNCANGLPKAFFYIYIFNEISFDLRIKSQTMNT